MRLTGTAAALAAAGGVSASLAACERRVRKRSARRRVVVFGVGGMDAATTERLLAAGQLPHLAQLVRRGTFAPLRTTTPAEAEVAWTALATGLRPGRNGIFGRWARDAATYRPLAADVAFEPARTVGGRVVIPPRYCSYSQGEPFWRYAARAGIATVGLWTPADFPPAEVEGSSFLAGLGVPGAWLNEGPRYYYFSTGTALSPQDTPAGGCWRKIKRRRGGTGTAVLDPPAGAVAPPLEITFQPEAGLYVNVTAAGQTQRVGVMTYSDYFSLPAGRAFLAAPRMTARFFVITAAPEMLVYMTPPELEPGASAVPLAAPRGFAAALNGGAPYPTTAAGLDFATLHDRVLGPAPFFARYFMQAEEKRRLSLAAWENAAPDLFLTFNYGVNEISHALWRFTDGGAGGRAAERFFNYADALEAAYRDVDATVGKFLRTPGTEDAAVFVVSAHGQAPFHRAFDLNRWLWENGYLKLATGARPAGVDAPTPEAALRQGHYRPAINWEETTAAAQGFGQLYLNVKGRDARGRLAPGDVARVKAELRRRLLAVRDDGRAVATAVEDGATMFAGPRSYAAPDLVVSLAAGYRVAWENVTGGLGPAVFADNRGVWTGDHASVTPAAVPGLLLSNVKLDAGDAAVEDVGPTVLRLSGLDPPRVSDGKPLDEK